MKEYRTLVCRQAGFTLIEMIVTIIVAAILGAMFLQIMGTSLTGSVEPLIGVRDNFSLNQVMERITADYRSLISDDLTPLATLKGRIGNQGDEIENGTYGSYTLTYNDYIVFNDSDGDNVFDEVHDNGSGGYRMLRVTVSFGDQRLTSLFTE
jgi:prepilin-type N-terminal cleavage/methylation domain-containing protein